MPARRRDGEFEIAAHAEPERAVAVAAVPAPVPPPQGRGRRRSSSSIVPRRSCASAAELLRAVHPRTSRTSCSAPVVAERHPLARHRRARPRPAQPAALRRPDLAEDRLRGRDHLDDRRHRRSARSPASSARATDQGLMRLTDLFLVVPELAILAVALEYFGHTRRRRSSWCSPLLFWMCDRARRARPGARRCARRSSSRRRAPSGASPLRIIVRHIVPNIIGPIMVNVTLGVAARDHHRVDAVVPRASACSRRRRRGGRCSRTPRATSGRRSRTCSTRPGSRSSSRCSCVNFIGDGLRDAFDPQSETALT